METFKSWGNVIPLAAMVGLISCAREEDPVIDRSPGPSEEGVAIVMVYDTSSSMGESVLNATGESEQKFRIAARAYSAIIDELARYVQSGTGDAPRRLEMGLIFMDDRQVRELVRLGPFDAHGMKRWVADFKDPAGLTPLGLALDAAGQRLLSSRLTQKHILVITDGENTTGPEPAEIMTHLQKKAGTVGAGLSAHVVAFDVNASVFDPIKRLGATVVAAADETQLREQLDFVLKRKILLENEE